MREKTRLTFSISGTRLALLVKFKALLVTTQISTSSDVQPYVTLAIKSLQPVFTREKNLENQNKRLIPSSTYAIHVYIVVQFYPWFNF